MPASDSKTPHRNISALSSPYAVGLPVYECQIFLARVSCAKKQYGPYTCYRTWKNSSSFQNGNIFKYCNLLFEGELWFTHWKHIKYCLVLQIIIFPKYGASLLICTCLCVQIHWNQWAALCCQTWRFCQTRVWASMGL